MHRNLDMAVIEDESETNLGNFLLDAVSQSGQYVLSFPSSIIPTYWQRGTINHTTSFDMQIEDIIIFDSDVLVIVHAPPSEEFPTKDRLECRYGNLTHAAYRRATAVHLYTDRAAVVCGAPPENIPWDMSTVLIEIDSEIEIRPKGEASLDHQQPLQWHSGMVVYEVFPTEEDVVVFVHGINHTWGAHSNGISEKERLQQFQCVYGDGFRKPVTAQAQEVFRCEHPPEHLMHDLAGKKMGIKFKGTILPSVAYYNPKRNSMPADSPKTLVGSINRKLLTPLTDSQTPDRKRHNICSCTMVYNGAKFLKEWVYYNSHLGVEKFIIYDNNSDDNLDEVVASLRSFNVTTKSWPWVKTQEAGFSHCSLLAQPDCTWMLFTDIDEYFFPKKLLSSTVNQTSESAAEPAEEQPPTTGMDETQALNSSILARFVEGIVSGHHSEINGSVGQISTLCHNFGPSNLTVSPPKGVTQGYTCRMKQTQRHKSIVLLSAIDHSLANVIHHFTLKPGYDQKLIRPAKAVINHYKFQVWGEFKAKFRRRAATYVADWTEDRSLTSKDRVPDLGTKAVKPADWETRYCEVQDYGLRKYMQQVFGSDDGNGNLHFPWEGPS